MALNERNIIYGFGAMGIMTMNDDIVGFDNITGSFTANISGDLLPVVGGAASMPISAVKGRSDGAMSITLNDRPDWIEEVVNGMEKTSISGNDFTLSDVNGSIKDKLTAESVATETPVAGVYMIKVLSATSVSVTTITGGGIVGTETVTAIDEPTAKAIGSSSVALKLSAANSLKDTDIGATALLTIAHSSNNAVSYVLPTAHKTVYSRVLFFTAAGGPDQDVRVHDFAKVALTGAPPMATDNELQTTEINGIILDPMNGTRSYRETILAEA